MATRRADPDGICTAPNQNDTLSMPAVHIDGTIFSVYSTGSENLVHRFKGTPDGRNPVAGLTNVNGVLYGTTLQGGANNLGTVFELTRDNNEIVLHSFGGQTGLSPYAGLLELNGTLYGTTYGGGKNAHGNVFSLTP